MPIAAMRIGTASSRCWSSSTRAGRRTPECCCLPYPTRWRAAEASPSPTTRIALTWVRRGRRSEEHTSELQSLMRTSYAVFCLKKKKQHIDEDDNHHL